MEGEKYADTVRRDEETEKYKEPRKRKGLQGRNPERGKACKEGTQKLLAKTGDEITKKEK